MAADPGSVRRLPGRPVEGAGPDASHAALLRLGGASGRTGVRRRRRVQRRRVGDEHGRDLRSAARQLDRDQRAARLGAGRRRPLLRAAGRPRPARLHRRPEDRDLRSGRQHLVGGAEQERPQLRGDLDAAARPHGAGSRVRQPPAGGEVCRRVAGLGERGHGAGRPRRELVDRDRSGLSPAGRSRLLHRRHPAHGDLHATGGRHRPRLVGQGTRLPARPVRPAARGQGQSRLPAAQRSRPVRRGPGGRGQQRLPDPDLLLRVRRDVPGPRRPTRRTAAARPTRAA